jgi:tetratricopeptide (TPR) repeat protein
MGKKNKAFDKGKDLFYKKNYEKAEKFFLKAISEEYSLGAAHLLLGKTYAFLNKFEEAIEYFDNSTSFLSNKEEPLKLKMNCLKQLGRTEDAEKVADELNELKSNNPSVPNKKSSNFKYDPNEISKMNLVQLKELIRQQPNNLGVWIFLANAASQDNKIEELYASAEEIMHKDPYNYFTYIFLIDKEMYGHDFKQDDPSALIKYTKRILTLRGASDKHIIEFIEERLIQIIAVLFTSENFQIGVDLVNFILDSKFPLQSHKLIGFCGTILNAAGIIDDINDIKTYISNYKPNLARLVEIGAEVTKEAEKVGK